MGNEMNTASVHTVKNFSGCGCTSVPKFGYPSDTPVSAFTARVKKYNHVAGVKPVVPNVMRSDRKTVKNYTAKVK